jgi:tripartite-type tricarboxylate transporter receptor subunit TctC
MRRFAIALAFGLSSTMSALAADGAYPSRQITIIAPFAAGSTTDIATRHFAERLKTFVKQSVVVEALAGANGIIGTGEVKNRAADGHTLLMGTISTMVTNYSLYKSVPYQPSDFTPIGCLYKVSPMIAVRSTLPIKTVAELVEYGRANPGKLTYGWSNSTTKIGGSVLSKSTATPIRDVPYKGSPQIITDMIGKRVDIYVDSPPPMLSQIKDGSVRLLGTTAAKRAEAFPDAPTLTELGFTDAVVDPWGGSIFIKAGAPVAAAKELEVLVQKVAGSEEFLSDLRKLGLESKRCDAAELAKMVETDVPLWEKMITSAGIEKQ